MKPGIFIFVSTLWFVSGCSSSELEQFEGVASYYSLSLDGNKTASGEIYKHWGLSAAHRKLAFGTRLRVTNKANNYQVVVVVNDRGPFVEDKIIDLSGGAAKKLGMLDSGVADVLVEILE